MPGGLNAAIETAWRAFRADGLMAVATVMLALLLLAGLFGPLLPIGDPTAIGSGPRLAPPSLEFPLGTDELGRSNLPRVVGGIYVTFVVAAVAVLLTGMLGVMIGLTAAYFGGRLDMVVARFADILYAFPAIILGLMLASIIGPGSIAIISVIVAATLPLFIRVVRSVALSIASREFVTAAEVAGASALRVMLVHLLPNVAGAVIIQLTYALSIGMLIESALSFLGLGTQPPYPSLGSLLQLGAAYLTIAPWLVFPPGLILALAILSVNLVGDGLRDAIDPLRGKSLT
jgi:peptide/nickel transport system permease protein